jgi:hypothetical protein
VKLTEGIRRFFGGGNRPFAVARPTGCRLWRRDDLTDKDVAGAFEAVEAIFDDGVHNSADLVRCRDCGQLYLSIFEEHVTFSGGDDDLFRLYLPVRRGDDVAALARFGLLKLSERRPHLRADPGHVHWVR